MGSPQLSVFTASQKFPLQAFKTPIVFKRWPKKQKQKLLKGVVEDRQKQSQKRKQSKEQPLPMEMPVQRQRKEGEDQKVLSRRKKLQSPKRALGEVVEGLKKWLIQKRRNLQKKLKMVTRKKIRETMKRAQNEHY